MFARFQTDGGGPRWNPRRALLGDKNAPFGGISF